MNLSLNSPTYGSPFNISSNATDASLGYARRPGFSIYEIINITVTSIYFIFGFPTNLLSVIVCFKSLFEDTHIGSRLHKRSVKENLSIAESRVNAGKMAIVSNGHAKSAGQSNIRRSSSLRRLSSLFNQPNIQSCENLSKQTSRNDTSYTTISNENDDKRKPFLIKKSRNISNIIDYHSSDVVPSSMNTDSFSNKAFEMAKSGSPRVADFPKQMIVSRAKSHGLAKTEPCSRKPSLACGQPSFKSVSSLKINSNPHRKCFELYLIEISLCDLLILAYNFMEVLLLLLVYFDMIDKIYSELVNISKFMCRFIIGFNRTITLIHNWLLASMAITRCYAIYKPLNSTAYYSVKFYYRLNLLVVFSLIVIFSGFNTFGASLLEFYLPSERFDSANLTFSNDTLSQAAMMRPMCGISPSLYKNYKYIEVYINVTLGIIGYSLPCFITLIINLVLIYKIRHMLLLKTSKFRHNLVARRSLKKNHRSGPQSQTSDQDSKSAMDSLNDATPNGSSKALKSPSSNSVVQLRSSYSWSATPNKNENAIDRPSTPTNDRRRKAKDKKPTEVYAMAKMKRYQFNQAKRMANGVPEPQIILNNHPMNTNSRRGSTASKKRSVVDNKLSPKNMNTRLKFFKTTSSLLTLSFAYLICYLPYSFIFFMMSLDMLRVNGDLIFVLSMLRYLNHTLNFYIYYCTGKRFRNCVKQFLRVG